MKRYTLTFNRNHQCCEMRELSKGETPINGEFYEASELRELLEKRKKTWNSRDDPIRCSVLDWLLAELEEGARK